MQASFFADRASAGTFERTARRKIRGDAFERAPCDQRIMRGYQRIEQALARCKQQLLRGRLGIAHAATCKQHLNEPAIHRMNPPCLALARLGQIGSARESRLGALGASRGRWEIREVPARDPCKRSAQPNLIDRAERDELIERYDDISVLTAQLRVKPRERAFRLDQERGKP
jgi:hypothetical protein